MMNRKAFLKNGGISLFGIGLGGLPIFLTRTAQAANLHLPLFKNKQILVFIFQRGAMDGLMAVTPFTDEFLKSARPNLFIDAAKSSQNSLIDLDGKFGLHPAMKAFEAYFKSNQLAIIHGMGSPNSTRSHFDAQDYMETGTPFNKGTNSGWLNRAIGLMGHDRSPFSAVSLTSSMPKSFYGEEQTLSISNLQEFKIQLNGSPNVANHAAKSFEDLYDATTTSLLNKTGKESFEAMNVLKKADVKNYKPSSGAIYPQSPLGNSLKQIAQLIKLNVGLEVAFAESGGWDTHFNQGASNGVFANNVKDLSQSIEAFWKDLDDLQNNVTIMTTTEFGRTVKQNGTGGTDHGRASCSFVLGNNVNGGKVYGNIQPLAKENLADGRDLAVTTDFRSVFSAVADKHLQIKNDAILFPDWKPEKIDIMKM